MEKLAIDKIIVSNSYLRTDTDINSLKKSIETVGLINPLTVNSKNELLAGGRRYSAMKELGMTDVLVLRVDLSDLEQELISIDENLVRCPLNKLELEQCLNRGREIYEKINPSAIKIDTEARTLTPAEKKAEKQEEEEDMTSFAAVTAEKIGLSKSVIKNAIKRDVRSSTAIKQARGAGEISASQVNELIKLDEKEQDKMLPYIKEKSVKEVRKLVDRVRSMGIEQAIEYSLEIQVLPREFTQLSAMIKRSNKQLSKIIVENIDIEGDEFDKIVAQVQKAQQLSKEFLKLYDVDDEYTPLNNVEYEDQASIQQ